MSELGEEPNGDLPYEFGVDKSIPNRSGEIAPIPPLNGESLMIEPSVEKLQAMINQIKNFSQQVREDPALRDRLKQFLPEGYDDPDKIDEWIQEQSSKLDTKSSISSGDTSP
jgi:hypothetical protein